MQELTTIEAAALLTERGHGGYKGKPLSADAVKHMCARGVFPNAQIERRGPGRGYWLIPLSDIDAFTAQPLLSNGHAPASLSEIPHDS